MRKQILPNQYRYIGAEAKNISIRVNLENNKHLIEESDYNEIINQYNRYLDERESCNTIRLTAQVNLIADNVLFNHVTEVVKDEGSDKCICLNFTPTPVESSFGKHSSYKWGNKQSDLTRDTQLSAPNYTDKNYQYQCGIDIFNNHILRATTKFSDVYPEYSKSNPSIIKTFGTFNTINQYAIDVNGVKYYSKINSEDKTANTMMYAYGESAPLSFDTCLSKYLERKNGWYGFTNKGKMTLTEKSGKECGTSRVINNKALGTFVEMFPGRDRFQLMPHYNSYRHRMEKNWEYCLTYPYSSTTKNITCINEKLNTLRIAFIDETTTDSDDLEKTTIFSVSKHGLQSDDTINIYRSTVYNERHELVEENVVVDTVIDDYTFVVYLSEPICKEWLSIEEDDQIYSVFNNHYDSTSNRVKYGNLYVYAYNGYINGDVDEDDEIGSHNLSFCKTNNGYESKYYVRLFSRFPNFDLSEKEIGEKDVYSKDEHGELNVTKYAHLNCEKASTMTRLGFSKNAYGDDMAQIVYTDDICLDYLHDNLGRPLTNLYLSFFKTNYGHNEWYNYNTTSKDVEWSHCFGPLTCGFKYNPVIEDSRFKTGNINFMGSSDGFSQTQLRRTLVDETDNIEADEILYKKQDLFYGDLCSYDPYSLQETSIQPILNRFNTQQRELSLNGNLAATKDNKFQSIVSDEVSVDDNWGTSGGFKVTNNTIDAYPTKCYEGYYYRPHYQVPIRALSADVSEYSPKLYKLSELISGATFTAKTTEANYIDASDKVSLYSVVDKKATQCTIKNVLSTNVLTFEPDDFSVVSGGVEGTNINADNYRIYLSPAIVPSYADIADDGSGRIRWREIYQNGFEDTSDAIEEYPFTNDRLYIHKKINIFVRRQDPFGDFGMIDEVSANYIEGYSSPYKTNNENGNSTVATEDEASC